MRTAQNDHGSRSSSAVVLTAVRTKRDMSRLTDDRNAAATQRATARPIEAASKFLSIDTAKVDQAHLAMIIGLPKLRVTAEK